MQHLLRLQKRHLNANSSQGACGKSVKQSVTNEITMIKRRLHILRKYLQNLLSQLINALEEKLKALPGICSFCLQLPCDGNLSMSKPDMA